MQREFIENPEPKEWHHMAKYEFQGAVLEFDVDVYNAISEGGLVLPHCVEWAIYQNDLSIELTGKPLNQLSWM